MTRFLPQSLRLPEASLSKDICYLRLAGGTIGQPVLVDMKLIAFDLINSASNQYILLLPYQITVLYAEIYKYILWEGN